MKNKKNKKFTVTITRTETYYHTVQVEAKTKAEAEEMVREMDDRDKFLCQWNELDFELRSKYKAEEGWEDDED